MRFTTTFSLYIDDEETAFQTRRKNGNFSHNNVCLFHFFKSRRHALLFFFFQVISAVSFSARVSFKNVSVQECRIVRGIYLRWFLSGWISYVVNFLNMIKFIAVCNTIICYNLHKNHPQKYLKMILLECSRCETYRNIVYIKITRNTRFSFFPFLYFGAY